MLTQEIAVELFDEAIRLPLRFRSHELAIESERFDDVEQPNQHGAAPVALGVLATDRVAEFVDACHTLGAGDAGLHHVSAQGVRPLPRRRCCGRHCRLGRRPKPS